MTEHRAGVDAPAIRILLADAIDYAGLFPPAQLDMSGAVAEYASYLQSADRWALGRFVVPLARLDELVAEGSALGSEEASLGIGPAPWRLSVLLGNDLHADIERARAFDVAQGDGTSSWRGRVEAVELKASSADQVETAAAMIGGAFAGYVEVPIASDPAPLVRAIGANGLAAKVRTGGTTADAFPTAEQLVRFLAACIEARVPFKATAGLHHPLRGDYALTYAQDSARGTMFGFLNVFLAAAFLEAGVPRELAEQVIEETSMEAVRLDDDGVTWRGHRLGRDQLIAARRTAITSFGSCSFREPIDDLASLGML